MEQIDPRKLLIHIARILERLNIPYIVTGGIAVLVWGRPRFTADIDMVVELKTSNIPKLGKALLELSEAGYVDRQSIKKAILQEGEFNFVDGETGVKVDFWVLKKNAFDVSRLQRKIAKEILGQKIYFSSPEDLMLIKLQWFKESESSRQIEDVESILKISGDKLDMQYLKVWALKLGVAETLEKLLVKKV